MGHLIKTFDQIENSQSWNSVFQEIDRQSYKQERKLKLTTKIANSRDNVDRNRYRNVLAYDSSRVVLKRTDEQQSDYINASPLLVPLAKRSYILTQGPLSTTVDDFWQMVWEQNSALIIMLNKLVEKGIPKCHDYFSTMDCHVREFDSFDVFLKEEKTFDNYVIRNLELVRKDINGLSKEDREVCSRTIKHFQFTSWPDFGVPQSTIMFIEFLQKIRETGLLSKNVPAVVHCSAGIGRSGTFVVVDSVLSMVEEKVKKIDIAKLIVEMRRSRMGLIQTPQQLQFCWKTIADVLREGLISKVMKIEDERTTVNRKNGRDFSIISNNHIHCEENETSHLERSQTNDVLDLHAKSCNDLLNLKRPFMDSSEAGKEAKLLKRKERIEQMRARLRKCEDVHEKWHHFTIGRAGIGYACTAAAVAFAVYCIYRLTS